MSFKRNAGKHTSEFRRNKPVNAAKRAADRKANAMIAGSVAVAVLVAGAWWQFQPPAVDSATNCRMDGVIPSHTVVLIDATDALPSVAASDLRARLERIQSDLEPHAKLSILTVEGRAGAEPLREVFSGCNPGRGADANFLFSNPQKVERAWRSTFAQPLDAQIARLGSLEQASSTPLLEAFYLVGAREDFGPRVGDRQLVVVSDFLHHTDDFSHYRPPFALDDSLQASAYMRSLMPRLDGVSIEPVFVPRREVASLQGRAHRTFWRDYFRHNGSPVGLFEG